MKSYSQHCCEELNVFFDQLVDKSLERNKYEENSKEWMDLDRKCADIYAQAKAVFYHYNPEERKDSRRKG